MVAAEAALAEAHLNEAFDVWWPKLEDQFQKLPSEGEHENPERPEREILEEILALVRSQSRSVVATLAQERSQIKAETRLNDEPKLSSSDVSPAKAESPGTDDDLAKE